MDTYTTVAPDQLPAVVLDFLTAHAAREVGEAIGAFTADATVTDEGRTYRGTSEVLEFLGSAGSQFTYTTTLVGAGRADGARWVAVNRLEGDFPGRVAELRYRFRLVDDLVDELVIAP